MKKYIMLNISNKMLIGYLPLVLIIITTAVFTLYKLKQVIEINKNIINADLAITQTTEDMIDVLLSQESYCQRYMILKSQDILSLFWKRDNDFTGLLKKLKDIPTIESTLINNISKYHNEYIELFNQTISKSDSAALKTYKEADSLRKIQFESLITSIKNFGSISRKNQREKTRLTAIISQNTFRYTAVLSLFGIILGISTAMIITKSISKSIKKLRIATSLVSDGQFENLPVVENQDELGELSWAFNQMASRLRELEKIHIDSSPLTRLPGGIAIENKLKKRINNNNPFSFCIFDLDNFKPFNDRYGYARGNDVIKKTAKIIESASRKIGTPDDFVGHIGGDDFALITSPGIYRGICELVIKEFDEIIPGYYDQNDRENRYILSKSRQGKSMKFPIMTISIAAVCSDKTKLTNHVEVGEIIADLKKHAKSFTKSILVVDRREPKKS
ncbi:MAG: diguanylate cyclase [bacterium]